MLDVHPPHSPTHTWKDFFIHVGTICVGLLIAVSLEQSVEYFHRAHERHLLEDELHVEAEIMQRNAEIDIDQYDSRLKWLLAQRKDVDLLLSSHGKADLPARPYVAPLRGHGVEGSGRMGLLNTIWQDARADGRLALLPEGLKRAYGILANRTEQTRVAGVNTLQANETMSAYLFQFTNRRTPTTPAVSGMSEAQLLQYRALLMDDFEQTYQLRAELVLALAALDLVLKDGPLDQRALTSAFFRHQRDAQAAHPENFAKMADETDAEDAAGDKARK